MSFFRRKASAAPTSTTKTIPISGTESVDSNGNQNQTAVEGTQADDGYPHGLRLALIIISTFTTMFLVALDRLIISTAIPAITNDFHSEQDIGWYGSAYMLTNCAFQLPYGKLYTFYSVKTCYIISVLFFEVGSAICGAAPSSTVFIIGRAISGIGSAGIMSGTITVIVYALPLRRRPIFQGLFGAVFGIASVLGPLLGGVFTTDVTWRWCFYINLPFGGVAMVLIWWLLNIPTRKTQLVPTREKLGQLDFLGLLFLLPAVVCLLLALQWGGSTYTWSNGRIIALLVLTGVLFIGFIAVQILFPATATIPPRIFCQRSIIAAFCVTFCMGASMMLIIYYLPIWFQAIEGVSAVDSGIRILALVLSMVIGSVSSGALVTRTGYYTPVLIFGVCLASVGAGLLTMLQVDTSESRWLGYQVVYGFGLGCSIQAPNLAAQTVLPTIDVPVGTSVMFFAQLLGGAIFTSVGNNVLDNVLLKKLAAIPGINPEAILGAGATGFLDLIPASAKEAVLMAYNSSLRSAFIVGLAMTCVSVPAALALEWRSTKDKKPDGELDEAEDLAGHGDQSTITKEANDLEHGRHSNTAFDTDHSRASSKSNIAGNDNGAEMHV
ncbi:putative MFS aflatoxin efflux pump [Coniella lustricola]|uniref:Putative MFS aflatoxin efflux pump n=1 Tax=Coniella lustricola TaxID=2025994 RepID=A0A2T3AC22_9PEZI|nr:putative MFS aflatoxin efflux pump [Coniella lustricola]